MVSVTDAGADGTNADPINHLTCVTMIPVLVHELLLCHCVCTQLVVQRFLVLTHNTPINSIPVRHIKLEKKPTTWYC